MAEIDFSSLRKKKGSNVATLQKQLDKNGQGGFKNDERIWKPMPNKQNVCECRIRFLPIPHVDMVAANEGKIMEEDLTPMAKVIKHWFQGPTGKNYIEASPAMFGDPCPVREFDAPKWASIKGLDDKTRKIKRAEMGLDDRLPRTEMYANILVIKDGTNPENEGQVKLLKFGNAIYKHIERAQEKKFSDDVIFDPFCAWEGADLIMNLEFEEKEFKGNKCFIPDYDKCAWAAPAELGEDTEIDRVWKASHSIAAFMDRSKVKSYDELHTKLYDVMCLDADGNEGGSAAAASKSADDMLTRMQMNSENAGAGEVESKSVEQKAEDEKAPKDAAESKPAEAATGGDSLDDFEDMLAGMGAH